MNIMYCTNMEQIINAMQGIKDEIKKLSVATTPPKNVSVPNATVPSVAATSATATRSEAAALLLNDK